MRLEVCAIVPGAAAATTTLFSYRLCIRRMPWLLGCLRNVFGYILIEPNLFDLVSVFTSIRFIFLFRFCYQGIQVGGIQPWPQPSLTVEFSPFQLRNSCGKLGSILNSPLSRMETLHARPPN